METKLSNNQQPRLEELGSTECVSQQVGAGTSLKVEDFQSPFVDERNRSSREKMENSELVSWTWNSSVSSFFTVKGKEFYRLDKVRFILLIRNVK